MSWREPFIVPVQCSELPLRSGSSVVLLYQIQLAASQLVLFGDLKGRTFSSEQSLQSLILKSCYLMMPVSIVTLTKCNFVPLYYNAALRSVLQCVERRRNMTGDGAKSWTVCCK